MQAVCRTTLNIVSVCFTSYRQISEHHRSEFPTIQTLILHHLYSHHHLSFYAYLRNGTARDLPARVRTTCSSSFPRNPSVPNTTTIKARGQLVDPNLISSSRKELKWLKLNFFKKNYLDSHFSEINIIHELTVLVTLILKL